MSNRTAWCWRPALTAASLCLWASTSLRRRALGFDNGQRGVLVDSHCHLADEAFSADLEPVVERARAANVSCALVILEAGNEREAAQARRVHVLWPESIVAVGVHPHIAHAYHDDPSRAAEVVRRQIGATPSARDETCSGRSFAHRCACRASCGSRSSSTRARPTRTPCRSSARKVAERSRASCTVSPEGPCWRARPSTWASISRLRAS
ncbi:MAG: hypothetical protein DMF90_24445 [Acidobacteria bacterium]|nr:MAG: hypothetical protein DMF90_24445 [Acidobacteriota bacterium]